MHSCRHSISIRCDIIGATKPLLVCRGKPGLLFDDRADFVILDELVNLSFASCQSSFESRFTCRELPFEYPLRIYGIRPDIAGDVDFCAPTRAICKLVSARVNPTASVAFRRT